METTSYNYQSLNIRSQTLDTPLMSLKVKQKLSDATATQRFILGMVRRDTRTKDNTLKQFQVSQEAIEWAQNVENNFQRFPKTDTGSSARMVVQGFACEHTLRTHFGLQHPKADCPDGGIDFVINQLSIDLKSQSYIQGPPTQEWFVNYPTYQLSSPAQYLWFCFYHTNTNKMMMAGWISKDDFKIKSSIVEKGQYHGRALFRNDTSILKVKDLHAFRLFDTQE